MQLIKNIFQWELVCVPYVNGNYVLYLENNIIILFSLKNNFSKNIITDQRSEPSNRVSETHYVIFAIS